MAITNTIVDEMVQRLVVRFNPLRIVLFGSCARDEHGENSDVDLLVIMPDGTDTRPAAVAMMSELRNAGAAKDVVVATPETLRQFGDLPGFVYRRALREGKVLYDKG